MKNILNLILSVILITFTLQAEALQRESVPQVLIGARLELSKVLIQNHKSLMNEYEKILSHSKKVEYSSKGLLFVSSALLGGAVGAKMAFATTTAGAVTTTTSGTLLSPFFFNLELLKIFAEVATGFHQAGVIAGSFGAGLVGATVLTVGGDYLATKQVWNKFYSIDNNDKENLKSIKTMIQTANLTKLFKTEAGLTYALNTLDETRSKVNTLLEENLKQISEPSTFTRLTSMGSDQSAYVELLYLKEKALYELELLRYQVLNSVRN